MPKANQNNTITLEEVKLASMPMATHYQRQLLQQKILNSSDKQSDEALHGAILFLEDHHFDFDALHNFLETKVSLPVRTYTPVNQISQYKNRLLIAAIFFLLIAGVTYIFFTKKNPNEIISSYVFYEPGLPVYASMDGDKDFNNLMSCFRLNETVKGLKYFNTLRTLYPKNDTLNYFGGWLYFNNHQFDSAANCFNKTRIDNSTYLEKGKLMEGFSLYLSGHKAEAKAIIQKIAADSLSTYQHNASLFLQKQSLW